MKKSNKVYLTTLLIVIIPFGLSFSQSNPPSKSSQYMNATAVVDYGGGESSSTKYINLGSINDYRIHHPEYSPSSSSNYINYSPSDYWQLDACAQMIEITNEPAKVIGIGQSTNVEWVVKSTMGRLSFNYALTAYGDNSHLEGDDAGEVLYSGVCSEGVPIEKTILDGVNGVDLIDNEMTTIFIKVDFNDDNVAEVFLPFVISNDQKAPETDLKTVTIEGWITGDNDLIEVTANDIKAKIDDNNKYQVEVPINPGDNKITIKARHLNTGNTVKKVIKIKDK